MMFIKPNEHIIVMEDILTPFSYDDIRMLEDAGMTLVYLSTSIFWDKIYHRHSDTLDWYSLDARIEKFLDSGLKIILPFYHTMPTWFPDDWYIKKHELLTHIIPNYANEEYGRAVDTFAAQILDRYSNYKNRIQLTYAIPAGGEFFWDDTMTKNYPLSDEVLFQFITNRQRALVTQHGEIWLYVHNFLGNPNNWNNTHLSFLYQHLTEQFPDNPLYSIQFAHFTTAGSPNHIEGQMKVKEYNEKYVVQFFVGSEYCEGLTTNFDAAIEQKVRGFFTAPMHLTHPLKHTSVQPWMVNALRETNKKFEELR